MTDAEFYDKFFKALPYTIETKLCMECHNPYKRKMPIEKHLHRCPKCKSKERLIPLPTYNDRKKTRKKMSNANSRYENCFSQW